MLNFRIYLTPLFQINTNGRKLIIFSELKCGLLQSCRTWLYFPCHSNPLVGQGLLIFEASLITLRQTTLGRTPLYKWSVRCTDLYLTPQKIHKRRTLYLQRDSNSQSQQASGRRPMLYIAQPPGLA